MSPASIRSSPLLEAAVRIAVGDHRHGGRGQLGRRPRRQGLAQIEEHFPLGERRACSGSHWTPSIERSASRGPWRDGYFTAVSVVMLTSAEGDVEALVWEGDRLRRSFVPVDRRLGRRGLSGDGEHPGIEVESCNDPLRADPLLGESGDDPGPAGDVEDVFSRPDGGGF